jgi:hypothetical protein
MKFVSPLVVSSLTGVLVITLLVLMVQVNALYATSRDRCEAFPKNYSYMITRFHYGNCQFRENEGWITFNPAS